MKIIKIIYLTFLVLCSSVNAQEVIISQGDTKVTFEDIDGFAFRMPNDIRKKYFSDIDKIDKLLGSLLNYKHIYNYNSKKTLIDSKELTKRLDDRVSKLFAYDDSTDDLFEKQSMFNKIKHFMLIEETYKMMQEYIVNSINEEPLVELAKEKYTFNKVNYQIPETRTIRYISFEKDNKKTNEQLNEINEILTRFKNTDLKFDQILSLNTNTKVILSDVLENITYKKNHKFSDFVFSVNDLGIIIDILETKDAFIIVKILDIKPLRIAKYSEVKDMLVSKIKNEKSDREFNKLLLKLTKDPVNINEANITLLSSRYN